MIQSLSLPPQGSAVYGKMQKKKNKYIEREFFISFPQEASFSDKVFGDKLCLITDPQFLWVCPRGLSIVDLGAISSILLTGEDCLKGNKKTS